MKCAESATPKNERGKYEAKWKPLFRVVRKKRPERKRKREKGKNDEGGQTKPDTRENLGVGESVVGRSAAAKWEGDTRQAHANNHSFPSFAGSSQYEKMKSEEENGPKQEAATT